MATKLNLRTAIASACLLLVAASVCLGKEWRGIVPLHSTCEDVKRILKVSECRESYQTDEGRVEISYSKKPCVDGWNVPPGTVLYIAVTLKAPKALDQMGFDLTTFTKDVSSDCRECFFYTNREEGITLSGSGREVDQIEYSAAGIDEYLRWANSLVNQRTRPSGAPCCTVKFDEYGELPLAKEHKHLDDFVREYSKWVREFGQKYEQIYIIVYAGRRAYIGEAQERAERIKEYLVKVRGFDKERIARMDGGYREHLTVELFFSLTYAAPPTPSPTVCPSEVELISGRVRR